MTLHVVPINDLIAHDTTGDCACGSAPQAIKHEDGSVRWAIVHHALDGREQHETAAPSSKGTSNSDLPASGTHRRRTRPPHRHR